MTNTAAPIFPFHHPQHFSDYGFDSQIDYFQVLEEARKHKRETHSSRSTIDNLHFMLQKPISKEDHNKKIKKTRKRWWWKNALHFFKRKRSSSSDSSYNNYHYGAGAGVRAVSGPVYLTDSRSGSATPYHRTSGSRPSSGPLKGYLDIATSVSLNLTWTTPTRSPPPGYLFTWSLNLIAKGQSSSIWSTVSAASIHELQDLDSMWTPLCSSAVAEGILPKRALQTKQPTLMGIHLVQGKGPSQTW